MVREHHTGVHQARGSSERGPDYLAGRIVAPGSPWIRYRVGIAPDDRPKSLSFTVFSSGQGEESPPLQHVDATVERDSLIAQVSGASGASVQRLLIGPNAWPVLGQSTAEMEYLLAAVRGSAADSIAVPALLLMGGGRTVLKARFFGADSASITLGDRSMVHFDREGRVVHVVQGDGRVVVTRTTAQNPPTAVVAPDYQPPVGAPYRAEEVRVNSTDGTVLAGTLTVPAIAPRVRLPAVVTISGSGPQDRDSFLPFGPGYRLFRQIADTLSRRGIAVLRLDDRGTGASTGSFAAATEVEFVADVAAAVAFLRTRPDIDPDQIALLGHSEGGVIGPLVAARDPRLAALVLMAGPADPRAVVLEQNRQTIATASTLTQTQRDSLWQRVPAMLDSVMQGSTWFGSFLRYDGRATAAQIKAPVLILQGATDTQVPPGQAALYERYFQEGGNRAVSMVVYPERNHLFLRDPDGSFAGYARLPSMIVDHEVLGTLTDWLVTILAAPAAPSPP